MRYLMRLWPLALVVLLSIFTILPFFQSGFFSMHDDTQVARVFEMGKALRDGMFPVRWSQDLGYGYGYPIFNFYSPAPYYLGGLVMLSGVDALFATKIVFVLGILLASVSVYFMMKNFTNEIVAVTCAFLYIYFPYHAVNTYVRGDLDEIFTYGLLPLVFLGIFKIFQMSNNTNVKYPMPDKEKAFSIWHLKFDIGHSLWILWTGISLALIAISHNLTFFMLMIFLVLFCLVAVLFARDRKRLIVTYGAVFFLSFLLSAFYTLPAVFESKYTNVVSQIGGNANPLDHFVCLPQLWDSPWGFGGSVKGCVDGLSFRLGKINILLFIISIGIILVMSLRGKIRVSNNTNVRYPTSNKEKAFDIWHLKFDVGYFYFLSIVFALFSIFMMTDYSAFIWKAIPFMPFLQYPWRFLNFAGLFMVMTIGFGIYSLQKFVSVKILCGLAILIICGTLITNIKLFQPQYIYPERTSQYYTNKQYLNWTVSKISDEYMPPNFKKPNNSAKIPSSPFELMGLGGGLISPKLKTDLIQANFLLLLPSEVRLNIAYYPAWKVYLDDKIVNYSVDSHGLLVSVPAGIHKVTAKFEQTLIQKISNSLSLLGILIVAIFILKYIYAGKKTS